MNFFLKIEVDTKFDFKISRNLRKRWASFCFNLKVRESRSIFHAKSRLVISFPVMFSRYQMEDTFVGSPSNSKYDFTSRDVQVLTSFGKVHSVGEATISSTASNRSLSNFGSSMIFAKELIECTSTDVRLQKVRTVPHEAMFS